MTLLSSDCVRQFCPCKGETGDQWSGEHISFYNASICKLAIPVWVSESLRLCWTVALLSALRFGFGVLQTEENGSECAQPSRNKPPHNSA